MTVQERDAKLKAWEESLSEDTKLGYVLLTRAFDDFLKSFENDTYDKEAGEMLKLYASRRYEVGADGGLAAWYAIFAEGFLAGLEVSAEATLKMLEEGAAKDGKTCNNN